MKPSDTLLERDVVIRATRATVFGFFQDSERFARWWGAGSTIDARPGGEVVVRYPNGVVARGEVLAIEPHSRIAFTFGYDSGVPFGPGASRVEIELAEDPEGTRVRLVHHFTDAAARDAHRPGWWYHLAVFARTVAAEQHAAFAEHARRWVAAWSDDDPAARARHFAACTTDRVEFRDDHACIRGRAELETHVHAARQHLGAARLELTGQPRQCQGTGLFDWRATSPDGRPLGTGTNACDLAPDGRLARVVGLWAPPG